MLSEIRQNTESGDDPGAEAAGPEFRGLFRRYRGWVARRFRGWWRRLDCRVKKHQHLGTVATAILLLLAVATYCSDQSGRVEDRTVEAWQLLLHSAPGSSGKGEALEVLNNADGIGCLTRNFCLWERRGPADLVGIRLDPWYGEEEGDLYGRVFLQGVQLPDANLVEANFQGAILDGADLSGADLKGAIFDRADLIGADLSGADLNGADLSGANLSGANLTDVVGLTQEQLDRACGNASTKLPDGLTMSSCRQEPASAREPYRLKGYRAPARYL
jgi:hypothetical protein